MKRKVPPDKHFSEMSGKLHIYCPYQDRTGIRTHVVIKGRYCYRSGICMVIECKYNKSTDKIENVLSLTW